MEKFCPVCNRSYADDVEFCTTDRTPLVFAREEGGSSLVGRVLARRFEIRALLGEGGMGSVYRGLQLSMQREVAIKVLRRSFGDSPVAIKRFFKEAQAASTLRHANTITVHDFGQTEDGLLFIAMELLEGRSLSKAIAEEGPLPPERAAAIVGQVCDAVGEAHQRGIIHRDLKPDNIFLVPQQGNPDFVKVLDFGIAKVPAAEGESLATAVGTVVGTPAYMSPEQAMGKELTPRSDLYSLGIILYELLAGVRPFQDTTPMGLMLRHLQEKPKPLREAAGVEVPQAVEGFLFRALAKAPDDRLPSAADFKRELRTAVFGAAWDSSPVPLLHMDTYGLPVVSRTPSGSVPALGDAAAGADLSVPAAAASRPTPPEKEPAEPARPTPGPRPLEVDLDAQAIGTAETMACEAVEEQVESPLPSVPAEAGNQVAADSRAAAQSLPPAPALAPASFSLLHCLLPHWMCRSGSRSGAPACPCCSLPCSPCSLPWVRPVHG